MELVTDSCARWSSLFPVVGGVCVFFSRQKASTEVPVQERRRNVRRTTIMQVAKITLAGNRQELCLLRDISPEGLKAEIYVPVEMGTEIKIELRTGHALTGRIARVDGPVIGMAFDDPIAMSAMLALCSFDDRIGELRPSRLSVNMKGLLRTGAEERAIRIGNISQAGVQIDAPEPLDTNTQCLIALPGLPARGATVRWSREGQAGLLLSQPFEYAEFAGWRAIVAS